MQYLVVGHAFPQPALRMRAMSAVLSGTPHDDAHAKRRHARSSATSSSLAHRCGAFTHRSGVAASANFSSLSMFCLSVMLPPTPFLRRRYLGWNLRCLVATLAQSFSRKPLLHLLACSSRYFHSLVVFSGSVVSMFASA